MVTAETVVPSPVAGSLLYDFVAQYMYEWDQPKAERQMQALMVGRELLSQLLDETSLPDLLGPRRCATVDAHLQYLADGTPGPHPRRTDDRISGPGRPVGSRKQPPAATATAPPGSRSWPPRAAWRPWTCPPAAATSCPSKRTTYRTAFEPAAPRAGRRTMARRAILRRVLSTHGPLTRDWLLARYPWEPDWLDAALEALVENGEARSGQISHPTSPTSP